MTDLPKAIISEQSQTIPLKELYDLKTGQDYFASNGIPPTWEKYDDRKMDLPHTPPHEKLIAKAQAKTLMATGLYESVIPVEELNTDSREKTGGYGFIVTRKPEKPLK